MASVDEKLKKLIDQSPLFVDGGATDESGGLDLSKLTKQQSITLARHGRAAGLESGAGRITGGVTNLEKQVLDAAAQQQAARPEVVVPNVQQQRRFRADERSMGGMRDQISNLAQTPTRERDPWTPPDEGFEGEDFVAPELPEIPEVPTQGTPGITASAPDMPSDTDIGMAIGKQVASGITKKTMMTGAKDIIKAGYNQVTGAPANAAAAAAGGGFTTQALNPVGHQLAVEAIQGAAGNPLLEGLSVTDLGGMSAATPTIALQAMGAANTAATGGIVGGAPIANLAAAEAAMQAGTAAATPALGMAGGIAGMAAIAAQIGMGAYDMFTRKAGSYSPSGLLRKAEQGVTSHTSDLRSGKINWDLTNPEVLDFLRNQALVEQQKMRDTRNRGGYFSNDRSEREAMQQAGHYNTFDRYALYGKGATDLLGKPMMPDYKHLTSAGMQEMEEVDVSGMSLAEINALIEDKVSKYDWQKPEEDDGGMR